MVFSMRILPCWPRTTGCDLGCAGAQGPTVEVPLDGTVYDLTTGEVLEWVPKNNPIRAVLNSLKSSAKPEPLKVYPVEKDDSGRIYANV